MALRRLISGKPPDGWFCPEVGASFAGTLVGYDYMVRSEVGGMSEIVFVELSERCVNATSKNVATILEPGQILGVGIRAALHELPFYVESRGMVRALVEGRSGDDRGTGGRFRYEFALEVSGTRQIPLELQKRAYLVMAEWAMGDRRRRWGDE